MDLTNAAYSEEYQKICNEMISVMILKEDEQDIVMSEGEYSRTITTYTAMYEGFNYTIMRNKVYNLDNILVHEYISFYHHPFFYTPVTHSNGREYLVYKEDLYGYSVLDIESKETFKYIPSAYLKSEETFIATDIHYNPVNDMFAAGGCFWAGRYTTYLLEVKDPMKQFTRYLDCRTIVPHQAKYTDVDFHEWDGNDILLKCDNEIIKIPQAKYMRFLKELL